MVLLGGLCAPICAAGAAPGSFYPEEMSRFFLIRSRRAHFIPSHFSLRGIRPSHLARAPHQRELLMDGCDETNIFFKRSSDKYVLVKADAL